MFYLLVELIYLANTNIDLNDSNRILSEYVPVSISHILRLIIRYIELRQASEEETCTQIRLRKYARDQRTHRDTSRKFYVLEIVLHEPRYLSS